jgi:hypothetical protein
MPMPESSVPRSRPRRECRRLRETAATPTEQSADDPSRRGVVRGSGPSSKLRTTRLPAVSGESRCRLWSTRLLRGMRQAPTITAWFTRSARAAPSATAGSSALVAAPPKWSAADAATKGRGCHALSLPMSRPIPDAPGNPRSIRTDEERLLTPSTQKTPRRTTGRIDLPRHPPDKSPRADSAIEAKFGICSRQDAKKDNKIRAVEGSPAG